MKEYHIISLGAGVQSTMLYLLACETHPIMPKIDCAIFADPGDEGDDVYDHLKWLQTLNGPPILVRSAGNLGDALMQKNDGEKRRFSAIPCFTDGGESGRVGMGKRQCTNDYKIAVVERSIRRDIIGLKPRQRMPKDVHVHQYIGFSFDETRRVLRVRRNFEAIPWATPHFPLWETNTTRKGAQNWLASRVPHATPRSACVFCPFHSDTEWLRIKTDAKKWARACEIDNALRDDQYIAGRGMRAKQYLHRSCVPLREADLKVTNDTQLQFGFVEQCEGMCGV